MHTTCAQSEAYTTDLQYAAAANFTKPITTHTLIFQHQVEGVSTYTAVEATIGEKTSGSRLNDAFRIARDQVSNVDTNAALYAQQLQQQQQQQQQPVYGVAAASTNTWMQPTAVVSTFSSLASIPSNQVYAAPYTTAALATLPVLNSTSSNNSNAWGVQPLQQQAFQAQPFQPQPFQAQPTFTAAAAVVPFKPPATAVAPLVQQEQSKAITTAR
jgi:hypothetical protein